VEDLYKQRFDPLKRVRRGKKHRLPDREVLTLALIAQWQEGGRESAFLRYAHGHWRSRFLQPLTQADYALLLDLRQMVEAVNGCLSEVLGLRFPRACSLWGLLTRIAAKVAAFNIAVHINLVCDRPTFFLFSPLQ